MIEVFKYINKMYFNLYRDDLDRATGNEDFRPILI